MEPLMEAIKSNDLTKAKEFLSTNRLVVQGLALFYVVRLVHDPNMLNTIFNLCGEEVSDYFKYHQKYILECAVKASKDIKIIEVILNLDKDCINRIDTSGTTPFIKAVSFSDEISLIKFLLKNNADVNICDTFGRTPLHHAKNAEVVKLLIESGTPVNFTDNYGNTPLMSATHYRRDSETILEFVKNGADVKIRNREGKTCLHLALQFKYDEGVINQICSRTLDLNVEDNSGLTPLFYAIVDFSNSQPRYSTNYINELINKGFVVNTKAFIQALKMCDAVDFISSLARHVNVKFVDDDGNCVLHHARDPKLISMFVRRGVNINHENNRGNTPLLYAIIRYKSIEYVESLLLWGSDVRRVVPIFAPDKYGPNMGQIFLEDSIYDLLVLYGMGVSLKNNFIN